MKLNDKQVQYLNDLNEKLKSANWDKMTMTDQIGNLAQRYAIVMLKNLNKLQDDTTHKVSTNVGDDLLSAFKSSVSKDEWKL